MTNSVGRVKHGWFWVLKHSLNPVAVRVAKSGSGIVSLVRHTGRKTGKVYETPIILAAYGPDFVAELTYGPQVAWYRNVVAAGGRCTVVVKGVEYPIDGIGPCDTEVGLKAYGYPAALILRLLRRRDFRLLHRAPSQTS